jgi:hypothetical protein
MVFYNIDSFCSMLSQGVDDFNLAGGVPVSFCFPMSQ